MSINGLNPNLPVAPSGARQAAIPLPPSSSFAETLRDAVSEVDNLNLDAQFKVTNLVEGNGVDVHDAMIAVEKADLSFQLMLQVRNKVVQAYQQIAGMQF
jgi:flagellar hook-basal body complex protein FliE